MSQYESYLIDLDNLLKNIDQILSAVPVKKNKVEQLAREQAELAASAARATIQCMKNDYIIK